MREEKTRPIRPAKWVAKLPMIVCINFGIQSLKIVKSWQLLNKSHFLGSQMLNKQWAKYLGEFSFRATRSSDYVRLSEHPVQHKLTKLCVTHISTSHPNPTHHTRPPPIFRTSSPVTHSHLLALPPPPTHPVAGSCTSQEEMTFTILSVRGRAGVQTCFFRDFMLKLLPTSTM